MSTSEYIINPYTNRKVKIGSRKYRDLINTGAIAQEYESEDESDLDINDLEWQKPEPDSPELTPAPEPDSEIDEEYSEEEIADEYDDLQQADLDKIEEYVEYIRNKKY